MAIIGDRRGAEQWVWDVDLLDWTRGVQPSISTGDISIGGVISVDDNGGSLTVDGPVTDTQLRAADVKITLDGEIPHVIIDSMPAGGSGLTDSELRATPVPVSGTVSTGALTDTQLRATAVPISAATLPLPSLAATSTLQTNGTQQTKITDGTDIASVGADGDTDIAAKGLVMGAYDRVNSKIYPFPVLGSNYAQADSNTLAIPVEHRAVAGLNGGSSPRSNMLLVGGRTNISSALGSQFVFGNGETVSAIPANTFALQTRDLGQSFINSGNIDPVGQRLTVSNRYVNWSANVFTLSRNGAWTGSVRPCVSTDNGSTFGYVSAINTATGAFVSTLTDAAVDGTYVIAAASGATDYGFEVTAKTSAGGTSVAVKVSANTGINSLFAAATLTNSSIAVTDNSGSLTVDAPVATPVYVRLSDGASAISTLPVSGPLTDTQLRATALPVSGTFWQTTQPVSGTFWQTTQPVSVAAAVAVTDNSGTLTVDAPVATPVFVRLSDGAAAIATLPVSGPLTDTQIRATALPVSGPLTDTQLRASAVPVSLATAPTTAVTNAGLSNLDVLLSTRLKPADTLTGVTTVAAVTAITNALPAGSNAIGKLAANSGVIIGDVNVVTVPAITKGTQGSTGVTTQDLKDAGRTAIALTASAVTSGTSATEALITFTKSTVAGAATSSASSFVITSGKTFRITAVMVATRNMAATTADTKFTLRINTAGAIVTTSNAAFTLRCATPATINSWDRAFLDGFEGMEIAGNGTIQFGMSVNPTWTTTASQYDVVLIGYEY